MNTVLPSRIARTNLLAQVHYESVDLRKEADTEMMKRRKKHYNETGNVTNIENKSESLYNLRFILFSPPKNDWKAEYEND